MNVDKETVVRIGNYMKPILSSDQFAQVVSYLRQDFSNRILTTKVEESAKREEAYMLSKGLDELLGMMVSFKDGAESIQKEGQEELDLLVEDNEITGASI